MSNPIQRETTDKLRRLAADNGATVEDFITEHWAEGGTYGTLGKLLGRSRGLAWKIVNSERLWIEAMTAGKRMNADRLAREALDLVDRAANNPALTGPQAQMVREQANTRRWLAACNSPRDYSATGAPAAANVTVNVQQLHLHALLQPGVLASPDEPDLIDVTPDEQ